MNDKKSKKPLIISSLVAAALVVGSTAGGTAYAMHYSERALPGTSVAGHSVAGKNRAEIEQFVTSLAEQSGVAADVVGTTSTVSLNDLGVEVDAAATADAVLAANTSVWQRFAALFDSHDFAPVVTRDADKVDQVTDDLARLAGEPVVEATVEVGADGVFTASESAPGKTIDRTVFEKTVDDAIATLSTQNVTLEAVDVEPEFTTEEAQVAAEAANALASQEVKISDGIDDFEASQQEKASWVTIPEADGTFGEPTIDRSKAADWVKKTAEETNVEPVAGIDNVDAAGNVLVESRPGKEGLTVNNADAVTDAIVSSLNGHNPYSGTFDYDRVRVENTKRPALPGAENYPYPAAEGEKWIDIDLSRNTVTAYEGLTPVRGPVAVNHGAPGRETVTGIYHVYLKYNRQDMGCSAEWSYCVKDVPWVLYFTGSYALHGAPWVSSFGRGSVGGSNGCVNLPVPEAEWLHAWGDIGTAVASHY